MGQGVLEVAEDDPEADDVQGLLARHLGYAHEHSPPEHVHALDVSGLTDERVSFFSVREDGRLLGIGALRHLDDIHAEVKSMHTTEAARGRGVGRRMLRHLLDVARRRGYQRVSLETGTGDAFVPARRLYASAGFEECEPFAGYWRNPHSVCMTLALAGSTGATA